jgi:hypothetical protein
MLGPRTQLLLSGASEALAAGGVPDVPKGPMFGKLAEVLSERNGFYAFESALHVFGCGSSVVGRSIEEWNSSPGWRASYDGLADGLVFFAEDAFGGQFAIRGDQVITFDPETASVDVMASSIEGWADQLIRNYDVLTGLPVAHAWQHAHGVLEPGRRLVPKRPFVLGGEYAVTNLYSLDAVDGMRARADLALQIKDLPDGTKIRYQILE